MEQLAKGIVEDTLFRINREADNIRQSPTGYVIVDATNQPAQQLLQEVIKQLKESTR